MNLFRRGDDPRWQERFVVPYDVSGLRLSPDETLSLSVVWACIDVIARALASTRWNVYQPTGPNSRQLLHEDPLVWTLNTRPNPEMTAIGFRESMLYQAIPFGNSYAEIVPDSRGRIAELWPLRSDRTLMRRDEQWNIVYEYRNTDGSTVVLPAKRVFHLRGPGLYGLMGENIVARAAKSIAVAAAQERYSAAFFGQGASPGGVLEYPGKLTPETHARLKEDWAEKRKGPENAHKPLILEAGMKFTATSIDPDKSQLVESRQFSVEEVCRWFGVPPHKVQHLLRATFSNIEHSSLEFVRDALTPWERRLCQEADYKLFPQKAPWRYTCIDLAPLSSGDAKSRADYYAVMRQNGIMSANEARAREGLDDAGPDGDVLLVQSNLTTVERLVNPPPAPALPAGPPAGGGGLDPRVPRPPPAASADDDEAASVARQAITAMFAGALERYSRRLANRRADLERRHAAGDVERNLAAERGSQVDRLLSELVPALPFAARGFGRALGSGDVLQAIALLDAGEPPLLAASKALPASCPQPG